jgi:hypothetical protein
MRILPVFSDPYDPFDPGPSQIEILLQLIHVVMLCYSALRFVLIVYKVIRGFVRFTYKVITAIDGLHTRFRAKHQKKNVTKKLAPELSIPPMESIPNLDRAIRPSPLYLVPMDTRFKSLGRLSK